MASGIQPPARISTGRKNLALGPLPPKFGSRTSTPLRGPRNGTSAKGRWGGVNKLDRDANELDMARKVLAVGPPPPTPQRREERDSGERTMGVGVSVSTSSISTSARKIIALGHLPPPSKHLKSLDLSREKLWL